MNFPRSSVSPLRKSKGFTLLELLVVIAIIGILALLIIPAMTSMKGGQSVSNATSQMSGLLEQARAHAMANNTYVFVGLAEADGVQAASARPQAPGTGRLFLASISSNDGTRGYEPSNPAGTWKGGTGFTPLGRLTSFEGIHLGDQVANPPAGMTQAPAADRLANITSPITFDWPLDGGQKVITFSKVLQFDPQGAVSIAGGNNTSRLEILLQPAKGNQVDAQSPNFAVLQINGLTGIVREFRP